MDAGAQPAVLNVLIAKAGIYAVQVQFQHGSTRQDALDAYALLGGARSDANGRWVEVGVPASFKVVIAPVGKSTPILVKEVAGAATMAGYRSRWAKLAELHLEPGRYNVEVTGFSESSALRSLGATAVVGVASHGK